MRKKYFDAFSINIMLKLTNRPVYINYTANKRQTSPSFGYRLPETVFEDVRDIPHLTCGCCGKEMLTKKDLKEILDGFKKSKNYKSTAVMKKLEPYRSGFKGEYKELLNIMEIYSTKYPDNTFAEIFMKPEVSKRHIQLEELYKKQDRIDQLVVFKELNKLSEPLRGKDKLELRETNTEALKVLNNRNLKPIVREALVTDLYENFAEKCSDKETLEKISNAVKAFPYDTHGADTFISTYTVGAKGDLHIIKLILENLLATYEHVLAESEGGTGAKGNGITLCKYCNNERETVPYPLFLKIYPGMVQNVQKQLNKVMTFIKHKKLINYEDYPLEVKITLLEQTDKKIKLKINDYLKYKEEIARHKLEASKAQLAENETVHKAAQEKLEEAELKLEKALAVVRQLKKEKYACEESLKKAWFAKAVTQETHDNNEKSLQKAKVMLEKDEEIEEKLK